MTTNNSNAGHITPAQATNDKSTVLNLFKDSAFFSDLFNVEQKTILLREYATKESN